MACAPWGFRLVFSSAFFSAVAFCEVFSVRRYLLLSVLIASRLAVSDTLTIPTGPFCGDCVLTNMTFYDVSQVDAWRIDLSGMSTILRADVRGTRNQITLAEYASVHVMDLVDSLLSRYDSFYGLNPDPTNVPFDRLTLENVGNAAFNNITFLNRAEAYLDGLEDDIDLLDRFILDDLPDYRATFAVMCEQSPAAGGGGGGACTNCCDCPDYTPYFVFLTNRVAGIYIQAAQIRSDLRVIYEFFDEFRFAVDSETGWLGGDFVYIDILSRIVQSGFGWPEFTDSWRSHLDGSTEFFFTYPIATLLLASNLVASVRHPNDQRTFPLGDSWESFQHDMTPSGLSTNLLWDRLTLPLFDLDAFLHWHLGQDQTYKDYKTIYGPSDAYWSLPNATAGVMSNFWESVHDRSEGRMGPSLVTYHNLLVLTNTVAQLEKMPVLDRITLLLWRIAKGGDDDNTNSPPDHLSSEIEDHDDADEIRAISWDTEDTSTASEQVSGILSGLRTLKSAISGTPDSTVRISGFSFPTIFGFTSPGFTTQSFRLADEGPLSTIYPIVRRVFILAWTLCMCWVVYRVAVFYLLLFGRVVAVLWPLLHGDMVKTAEAVHKVFDLTIFKAARFASFMGDFVESDASQYSWYGRDL